MWQSCVSQISIDSDGPHFSLQVFVVDDPNRLGVDSRMTPDETSTSKVVYGADERTFDSRSFEDV